VRKPLLAAVLLLQAALASAQQPSYEKRKEVKEFIAEMVSNTSSLADS